VKKYRFVWIDDNAQKVESFRPSIEAGPQRGTASATVEVLRVRKDVIAELEVHSEKWAKTPPDLIIIDQVFNVPVPLGLRGSSVAHLLRKKVPRTPMVCVTAKLDRPEMIDQDDLIEYIAVFPYTKFETYIEDLYSIARDFPKLRTPGGGIRKHLIGALKAPRRDRDDLERVLPEEFQDRPHSSTEHRMGRWIYNVLLQRPGFLYDDLHAATLLGLTPAGFLKVGDIFEQARYSGVFNTASNPRWWVSELQRVLFEHLAQDAPDTPQLAGRTLAGVPTSDYSKCYVSRVTDPPPEAVVYVDATPGAARKVVRREFAATHPTDVGILPGFETSLVLKKRPR